MAGHTGGVLVHPRTGERFYFDAGAVSLQFLTSGGEGELAVFESLHEPADLAAWAARWGLGMDGPRPAAKDFEVSADELALAKRLRAAIWTAAGCLAHGEQLRPDDLTTINEAAAGSPPIPRIDVSSGARSLVVPIRGAEVVSAFARNAIDIVAGPLAARVRECAASDCRLIFVDTSQPGRRRWCSMQRCGNRDKLRAYRNRRTQDH